jgi:hypothetical protein
MKNKFDLTIIGSGPCAIAALMKVKSKKILVITGQEKIKINEKINIHPKVEFHEKNKLYINDLYKNNNVNLFSSSKIGGLGNYWGQGCQHVDFKKLYQKKEFSSENEYLKYINYIYSFFQVEQNKEAFIMNNINIKPSPIINNGPIKKKTELRTFEYAFKYLVNKKKIKYLNTKVKKIYQHKNEIFIILNNLKIIKTNKIIFAANTIGNSNIMFNSDKEIKFASFQDDCPWTLYTISTNKNFKFFLKKYYSVIGSNLNQFFFSIYNFSKIKIDFLIFYLFRLSFKFLNKINCSFLIFFNFIQVWDKNSIVKIFIYRNKTFESKEKKFSKILDKLTSLFKMNNLYIIKKEKTKSGHGFHYHNLQFHFHKKKINFEDYLKKKFNRKAVCIDGSIYKKINPGPFTIALMALAQKKIDKMGF